MLEVFRDAACSGTTTTRNAVPEQKAKAECSGTTVQQCSAGCCKAKNKGKCMLHAAACSVPEQAACSKKQESKNK